MSDLTVIYLTANQHPEHFAAYQRKVFLEAIGDLPYVVIFRDSMMDPDFLNGAIGYMLDAHPKSHENMYRCLVNAAKEIDTPYIAVAEDDALYPKEHFTEFRPPMGSVAYDRHRWSLYTWTGQFSRKDRISNCTLIADRLYYIEAWEERFAKYPDGIPPHRVSEIGRHNQEDWMGVSKRNCVDFYASKPTIHINHVNGTDSVGRKKRMGDFRALEIPFWGRAEDIIKEYR